MICEIIADEHNSGGKLQRPMPSGIIYFLSVEDEQSPCNDKTANFMIDQWLDPIPSHKYHPASIIFKQDVPKM